MNVGFRRMDFVICSWAFSSNGRVLTKKQTNWTNNKCFYFDSCMVLKIYYRSLRTKVEPLNRNGNGNTTEESDYEMIWESGPVKKRPMTKRESEPTKTWLERNSKTREKLFVGLIYGKTVPTRQRCSLRVDMWTLAHKETRSLCRRPITNKPSGESDRVLFPPNNFLTSFSLGP